MASVRSRIGERWRLLRLRRSVPPSPSGDSTGKARRRAWVEAILPAAALGTLLLLGGGAVLSSGGSGGGSGVDSGGGYLPPPPAALPGVGALVGAGCVRCGTWRRPPRGGARKVEWISRVSRCGAAFPRTVNGNGFETDGLAASAGYRWVHLTVPTRHRPCALAAAGRHGCQSARWAAIEAFARLQAASHRAWRGRRHVARASLRS